VVVHDVAARGFGSSAGDYERSRPDYPDDAIDALVGALSVRPGTRVVDVGAGTGKLTRLLVPTGARLVAVEPLAGMRAELAQAVAGVPVVGGTAEALPFAAHVVDAVVAAQAFHWFSGDAAVAEIHRVLRPGGALGLVWNTVDEAAGWLAHLGAILDSVAGSTPRFRTGEWRLALDASDRFSALEERRFSYSRRLDRQAVVDWIATTSFVTVLPREERTDVLRRVGELVADEPEPVTVPYETRVYWCRAQP
jgi:SAM-dependent methyltransferase